MGHLRPELEVVREADQLLHPLAVHTYPGLAPAPAWRAVNFLAHSDLKQLRRMGRTLARSVCGTWTDLLARQTKAIVSMARNDTELVVLQRAVLVPLELRMLEHAATAPRTPEQVAMAIAVGLTNR